MLSIKAATFDQNIIENLSCRELVENKFLRGIFWISYYMTFYVPDVKISRSANSIVSNNAKKA